MKYVYIIFHLIVLIPFFFLHVRDKIMLNRFDSLMKSRKGGNDKDLDEYALYYKKVTSGKKALVTIFLFQLIDIIILWIGGFF